MPEAFQNPEIADAVARLDGLLTEADALVAELGDAEFCWRPEPGRWSISECLEHLSVTAGQYEPVLERCIREGRAAGRIGFGAPRRGWINGWIIRSMAPPVKVRVKAPKSFQPADAAPKDIAYPRFVEIHRRLRSLIAEADGLDLWRRRLTSPVTRWIRLSLGEAFDLTLTHMARHLWQARHVRQASLARPTSQSPPS